MSADLPTADSPSIADLGRRAKAASRALATASTAAKDDALRAAADLLVARTADVLAANAGTSPRADGGGVAHRDRPPAPHPGPDRGAWPAACARSPRLPDPVGEVLDGWVRPNGLRIRRVRVPLGVVAIIYENRPNVTSDAAGAVPQVRQRRIPARLVGGDLTPTSPSPAALRDGVAKAGLPDDAVVLVEDTAARRPSSSCGSATPIDCLIPRGGPSLIASILENATVPYVIDGDGNCHVYVDDRPTSTWPSTSSSTPRCSGPSVCNAAETLLVHESVADVVPARVAARRSTGVELVGDDARPLDPAVPTAGAATEDDWSTEFLDLKLAVGGGRLARRRPSTTSTATARGHSEAIVTATLAAAERFTTEVDAAAVLVNASTRFVDGEEFGFGAEIGISHPEAPRPRSDGPARADHRRSTSSWATGQIRG